LPAVLCLALLVSFLRRSGEYGVEEFVLKVNMGFWRDGNDSGDVPDARWGLANVDG
jgi:hypothetical protein